MSELGLYALRFSLAIAVFGVGAGVYAGVKKREDWTRVAERAALVVAGFVTAITGKTYLCTQEAQLLCTES